MHIRTLFNFSKCKTWYWTKLPHLLYLSLTKAQGETKTCPVLKNLFDMKETKSYRKHRIIPLRHIDHDRFNFLTMLPIKYTLYVHSFKQDRSRSLHFIRRLVFKDVLQNEILCIAYNIISNCNCKPKHKFNIY